MNNGPSRRSITRFSKPEIENLFTAAKRIIRLTAFYILRAPGQQTSGRALLVIPKKIGNAPQRNKLRRQLKEILWQLEIYKQPYDWVIIAKKTPQPIIFAELKLMFAKVMADDS